MNVDGWTILRMPITDGGSDRIEHTIRHFLSEDEQWNRLAPRAALAPGVIQDEVRARNWSLAEASRVSATTGRRENDIRWWREPRREVIERAHDQGYEPRYFRLAAEAQRGLRWVPSGEDKIADISGYRVVVGSRSGQRLIVLSAYKNIVTKELSTFKLSIGERLKDWCQTHAGAASKGKKDSQ